MRKLERIFHREVKFQRKKAEGERGGGERKRREKERDREREKRCSRVVTDGWRHPGRLWEITTAREWKREREAASEGSRLEAEKGRSKGLQIGNELLSCIEGI